MNVEELSNVQIHDKMCHKCILLSNLGITEECFIENILLRNLGCDLIWELSIHPTACKKMDLCKLDNNELM